MNSDQFEQWRLGCKAILTFVYMVAFCTAVIILGGCNSGSEAPGGMEDTSVAPVERTTTYDGTAPGPPTGPTPPGTP